MIKSIAALASVLLLTFQLTGCVGGGGATGSTGGSGGTGTPTVSVSLPATAERVISSNTLVTATVTDATGKPVSYAVVKFADSSGLVTISPVSGTALTNESGVATVSATAAKSESGAGTITVTASVAGTEVTGTVDYRLSALDAKISKLTLGIGDGTTTPLAALGTTSVEVTVTTADGKPVPKAKVTFSSNCATAGKATLTALVDTVTRKTSNNVSESVAIAQYVDLGCANVDTITASIEGVATEAKEIKLSVSAPSATSIQFVSVSPASITLKGMGGLGRQESALVAFKVVDASNAPIGGKTVNFSLSTAVGGIKFSNGSTTASAISDATTGKATILVNSGTVSTPVRVLASTTTAEGATFATQSDQLTITTGIPDQDSFSLSASELNIEGWDWDGVQTTITARLGDHFNNPVPDGTTVNFTAEGGVIDGSCVTAGGACSVKLTSQSSRPANGRVTVFAYAVGEESFVDKDGDGLADKEEMIDVNGRATDLPEAFRDDNEDELFNGNEPYIDFNSDGIYNIADGYFNGVLCDSVRSSSGTCPVVDANGKPVAKAVHVRKNLPILFSGSNAIITVAPDPGSIGYDLNYCGVSLTIKITVKDLHDAYMPAGTKINVSTSNGTLSETSFVVQNENYWDWKTGVYPTDNIDFYVNLQSDGVKTAGVCDPTKDATELGDLKIDVITPKGTKTTLTKKVSH